jgi:hypothetical protein
MGEDPDRCLLQQVIGDVANLRAEEEQHAQWLANRRQADAVALAKHTSEMAAIEASVSRPEPSEIPLGQRPKVRRTRCNANTWFQSKPWFAKPWFRQPSWQKVRAPVRRPILVLAGVRLSNYCCLPALLGPTSTELVPMERCDPPYAQAMSAASVGGANAACCSLTLRCSGARVEQADTRLCTTPRDSDSPCDTSGDAWCA